VIALLRSEARRLSSRRLVWVLTALALIGIVVGVGIAAAHSQRPSAAEQAAFDQQSQAAVANCLAGDVIPRDELHPGQTLQSFCEEAFQNASAGNNELQLSSLPDILRGTSFLLIVMGLVIGASSVGADWQGGTMATLLTWEPRRIRLLLMRAVTVAMSVFGLAILLQAVLSLGIAGAASTRGTTADTGGAFMHTVLGVGLRVGVMAALISLVGVGVSTIGRTTAASLGVVFVYLALVESLLHGLVPRIAPWLLSVNTAVFIDGRAQNVSDSSSHSVVVTPMHATLVVIAYAGVLLGIATAFFRRRDVT
jgi:ABC-2 type transport system permease protein